MKREIREVLVITDDAGVEHLSHDKETIAKFKELEQSLIRPNEPPKAEPRRSGHGHKPNLESQIVVNLGKKHNDYGTRECDVCHRTFKPRSGRAKVCDECRDKGALRRSKGRSDAPSAALSEVRKLAVAAGLRGAGQ